MMKSGAPRERVAAAAGGLSAFGLHLCFSASKSELARHTAFPPRSDARHGRSPGDQPARPRVEQQFAHARAALAGLPLARAVRAERDEDLFGHRQ